MIGKITFAIETLKICLGKEKSAEALIAVENIVLVTEEDLSAAEIGLWDLKELISVHSYLIIFLNRPYSLFCYRFDHKSRV